MAITDNMQKVIDLLNSNIYGYENNIIAFKAIDIAFNTFSSFENIAKEIYAELNDIGKKKYLMLWSLTGIELSYRWLADGFDTWDDRMKASQRYAYSHRFDIEKIFTDVTGYTLTTSTETVDTASSICFSNWCEEKLTPQIVNENYEESQTYGRLAFEISTMHSTLKQSFFGGTVKGVIIPEHLIEDENISFPFI